MMTLPHAVMTVHQPIRPLWGCGRCPAPWPCSTAIAELLVEFAFCPTGLFYYIAAQMRDFEEDLLKAGDVASEYVVERFVGWLFPGPRAAV
jgi:hypothetical protein